MSRFGRWKSFDFGPETSVDDDKTPKENKSFENEHIRRNSKTKKNKPLLLDLQKKLTPSSVADLAVHPKKIQEVEGWLKFTLSQQEKKCTPILLLTGPTGSGKTITVQVLAKTLNALLLEWVNPVDIDYEILKGSNQTNRFLEFFNESKYTSLFETGNDRNIVLVKDFPNTFIRNPDDFHSVLEDIYFKATHPVVFICTDLSSTNINLQNKLFPEELLLKYGITHISFNACAATLLKKAIKRAQAIISEHCSDFQNPSPDTVDAIIASSLGDIRTAMNQFYLATLKGSEKLPLTKPSKEKQGTKRKRKNPIQTDGIVSRDETLGLFHGLGRILNPKRVEHGKSWRISCDVGKLVDEFSIQPGKFNAFLFENYLKYFGELGEVKNAAETLSLSTQLMESWDHHDTLIMALWMCVLGLMVFNEHKVSKWNQIKGPRKIENKSVNEGSSNFNATDRFYYNVITKSSKYYRFNCD